MVFQISETTFLLDFRNYISDFRFQLLTAKILTERRKKKILTDISDFRFQISETTFQISETKY